MQNIVGCWFWIVRRRAHQSACCRLAGHADPHGRRGLRPIGCAAALPLDQDPHAARRPSHACHRHVHRVHPAPVGCPAFRSRPHRANMNMQLAFRASSRGGGCAPDPLTVLVLELHGDAAFLRLVHEKDAPPTGSGPDGLADFCATGDERSGQQRNALNVHLFHYHGPGGGPGRRDATRGGRGSASRSRRHDGQPSWKRDAPAQTRSASRRHGTGRGPPLRARTRTSSSGLADFETGRRSSRNPTSRTSTNVSRR